MNMTNYNLYNYHLQISKLVGTALGDVLLKGRINQFYKENGVRVNTIITRIGAIHKEFFVMDEEGNIKYKKPKKGKENEKPVPTLVKGKKMEDYDKAMNDYMLTEVPVKL